MKFFVYLNDFKKENSKNEIDIKNCLILQEVRKYLEIPKKITKNSILKSKNC